MVPDRPPFVVRDLRRCGDGSVEVPVELGEALFAGHFPGHPTLSAIGQLALVEAALRAWHEEATVISSLTRMRLTRRVEGGEVVVRLEEDGDGGVRFALLTAGEAASAGRVVARRRSATGSGGPSRGEPAHLGRAGSPSALRPPREPSAALVEPPGTDAARRPQEVPTAVDGPGVVGGPALRLPHAGVARMLTVVLAADGETIEAEATLGAESAFAGLGREGGAAPAWVAVEMAAQASAALEINGREGGGGGWLGYLVRLRRLRCRRDALPVAAPVRLTVTRTGSVATLRTYEALASLGGEELLAAELSLFFEPAG